MVLIFEPIYVVLSLFQRALDFALKLPRTTTKEGLIECNVSRVNSKLSKLSWFWFEYRYYERKLRRLLRKICDLLNYMFLMLYLLYTYICDYLFYTHTQTIHAQTHIYINVCKRNILINKCVLMPFSHLTHYLWL